MTSIMEKLAENKAKAQKLQASLDKVAPTKEQPQNQPGEWTRLRYSAMFTQYKTMAILCAECYAMLEQLQREIRLAEEHIDKLGMRVDRMDEPEAQSEIYDGDVPEDQELAHSVPVDPNHEFTKVINGEMPTDDGIEVLEEIDLLA